MYFLFFIFYFLFFIFYFLFFIFYFLFFIFYFQFKKYELNEIIIYLKQRRKREYYIYIKLKHFSHVNKYQYKTKRIIQNGRTIV
jgi:hypothetical protein